MGIGAKPHEGAVGDAVAATGRNDSESRPVIRRAVHPGEVLKDELDALGITPAAFAGQIAVERSDVTRILRGQRAITASRALRFGHWFGTEPEFWLNLQAQYDLALAERESGEAVRCMPTKETPLPPPRRTGRPRKEVKPADGRKVDLARELSAKGVEKLEKPVAPHETESDLPVEKQDSVANPDNE